MHRCATTLEVVITGFNIKSTPKAIEAKSQRVDFEVEYSALEIIEVVVNAESVTRQSDTLTYNVATFINVTDSSGDFRFEMEGISQKQDEMRLYDWPTKQITKKQ